MGEDHLSRFYPEVAYGGYTRVDGTIAFYQRVQALLRPDFSVLDVGCGRGAYLEDSNPFRRELRCLRGRVREIVGIDTDPAAAANPGIDRFALIQGRRWPVEDASFDLCLADWVLEHVAEPEEFFAEVRRVLRPGGLFCARTMNRYGYVAAAARLIPERLHGRVLARAQPVRKEEDVFPTHYRCNTIGCLRRYSSNAGLSAIVLREESEPAYAGSYRWAWALGVGYQRHAPRGLRNNLLVFARKQDESPREPGGAR